MNSPFVSQSVPTPMIAGQTYPVLIVMANTGTVPWTADAGYRLGSQSPQDNSIWGMGRAELPQQVGLSQKVTFRFEVTAPSAFGAYSFSGARSV